MNAELIFLKVFESNQFIVWEVATAAVTRQSAVETKYVDVLKRSSKH